jgi:glycosyltransferase involved in cell wall biosynthesis
MRTLGTLASPGTFSNQSGVLVGRTVANTQWLRALVQHGSMHEVAVFIGEAMDLEALEALTSGWKVPLERLVVYTLWQLPELLARGGVDALHHASHVERLYDLLALRNRYAHKPTPVTGQLHSLSYPRLHQEHARWAFVPPSLTDALFCSSTAGRTTMERTFDLVERSARERGLSSPIPRWGLPVVPLGVEVDALTGGNRVATRRRLHVPDDAVLLVCLARFTEFDKVDLFPLLRVIARLVHAPAPGAPPVHVLLAGARQGTKTPEMVQLWARHLKLEQRVHLEVDFAEADKRHLLAAGDVFVSPIDNVQETFGQSVIEAQAAGLPCVVSDFDGYKDTVDDEVGVRVPTWFGAQWSELSELAPLLYERPLHLVLGQSVEVDLGALETALRALVIDRPRRERLGRAAALRAKTRYDWKVVVGQLEATWRALATERWQPTHQQHPLRLDYDELFGHFATGRIDGQRLLVAAQVAGHVIYPELKSLVTEDDVTAALNWARQPQSFEALVTFLSTRLQDRPEWVASFIATWLVKQGLLVAP